MGGFGSGRTRAKRTQIEQCERRRGETCPKCRRAVKWLYLRDGGAVCRVCSGAIYRSQAEYSTVAAKIRKGPHLIGEALDKAEQWVRDVPQGTASAKNWSDFMGIIKAGSITPETSGFNNELQAEIVAEDIDKIGRLMSHVEKLIFAGTEEHTNRRNETSTIPMRPDALVKLGHLYLAAGAARAARAGIASSISATRSDITKREKNLTVSLLFQDKEAVAAAMLLTNKMAAQYVEKKAENDGEN
jgi:hypothetical protein